ncbi:MAG TPA: hypothetical protein VJI67_02385 [archaeon]|nr:hypothetical protein [archaeon]HLD80654.1 hypothetical protein [archaeon]
MPGKVIIGFLLAVVLLAASLAMVHGHAGETTGEENSLGHQLGELMPFGYLSEGETFAAFLSVVLWASLFYAFYSLLKKLALNGGKNQ